jgi:REP element-mobilizing transposase RayT
MPTKFDPKIHHRRSIRLPGYDYTQAGAYFVTLVTWQRECLFGNVVNGEMILNKAGQIVQWEWEHLAQAFKFVQLGVDQVMPNHFHGVLSFRDVGANRPGITNELASTNPLHNSIPSDLDGSPLLRGTKPASLGAVMQQFKSRVTKRLWKIPELTGTPIWQRNYYERIIRDEREMDAIWRYIEANPANWGNDEENPNHATKIK